MVAVCFVHIIRSVMQAQFCDQSTVGVPTVIALQLELQVN